MQAVSSSLSISGSLANTHMQNTVIKQQAVLRKKASECDCGERDWAVMLSTLATYNIYISIIPCY